ncbi:Glycosyl transferase group 1 [Alteromonadales bacterium TW-7]|nr:Glycosyl transferase group 1 [Alteromonadales bacterium TW-7]
MKVLHIITGLADGGAEAVLYRLCTTDTKNTHTVISLMGLSKYGPLLQQQGVTAYSLDMPLGRFTFSGLLKLYKLVKNIKPDAVQTWMYHADLIGGLVARCAGIKNITWGLHQSDLTPGAAKKSTILVAKLCGYLSYFVPKKIICCADKAAEANKGIGYCEAKLNVVYNGYDLNAFKTDNSAKELIKKEFSISNSTVFIGMVSRFHPFKDHENLIKALGIVKQQKINFSCLLVGLDMCDSNQQLMVWLQQNNVLDNIILAGKRSDIPHIMNGLDIHLLSSSSEAFPNVLNEAMACGTPCVTTDVGDAVHIVGDTGWVAKPQNPQDLASKIVEAINMKAHSKDAWETRQLKARERIENNFKIETMVSKYNEIWNS